jgi:hypothetical protein
MIASPSNLHRVKEGERVLHSQLYATYFAQNIEQRLCDNGDFLPVAATSLTDLTLDELEDLVTLRSLYLYFYG